MCEKAFQERVLVQGIFEKKKKGGLCQNILHKINPDGEAKNLKKFTERDVVHAQMCVSSENGEIGVWHKGPLGFSLSVSFSCPIRPCKACVI